MLKRLHRSRDNVMIAGVCAGVGDYFGIDPTIVRLATVVAACFGAVGLLAYIAAWIIVPQESE